MANSTDVFFMVLGAVLVGLVVLIMLIKYIKEVYIPYTTERDDLNAKIIFSTTLEKRNKYKKEMRALRVSLIPIVGLYISSRMRYKIKRNK